MADRQMTYEQFRVQTTAFNAEMLERDQPMPDTMIERVARALCAVNSTDPDQMLPHVPQAAMGDANLFPAWRLRESDARAAIAAMREPTVAMIDAMYDEYQGGGKGSLRDALREAIDAALSEEG